MADKVEITDVSKLRPELLEKSVKELERMKTEIEMAIVQKAEAEKAEQRKKLVEEAGSHVDQLLDSLKFLHDNGFLPESIVRFFTTEKGLFLPHLKLKKPRA